MIEEGDAGLWPAELGRVGFLREVVNDDECFFYSSSSFCVFWPLGMTGFVLLGRAGLVLALVFRDY